MTELDKSKTVSLQELMVSTLAMTDALAKLLIEKDVIPDAEFKEKLLEERGSTRASSIDNAVVSEALQGHGGDMFEVAEAYEVMIGRWSRQSRGQRLPPQRGSYA